MTNDVATWINKAKKGFEELKVGQKYKDNALEFLTQWLSDDMYKDYTPQIYHFIDSGYWDYLLDSFYQIIPFGTGGRRGEVGIGPNRINPWTIKSSAQGHSQYLLKKHEDAKQRGVVLAYDVRMFFTNEYMNDDLPNPVKNLSCKDLAESASTVYAANGIKTYIFDDIRTTPELSFAIRHLNAVAGDMFSASHNPPEHNGKKVFDEHGGQLIPPFDQELVDEVTTNVKYTKTTPYQDAIDKGLIEIISDSVDQAYIKACKNLSLSNSRSIKILFTPLHGCGSTSVLKVLKSLGYDITLDPKTGNPSGAFENVTFNIPNPEVIQSFDTPLKHADVIGADIILNSDPDADRIGIMVKHEGKWEFLNGNEIGAIITDYVIQKRKSELSGEGVVIKTQVTTGLITEIAVKNGMKSIDDLLVGFKFIGEEMNKLEKEGEIDNFLIASEESHGYLAGNYSRDKDAVVPAVYLAELASELKENNETLVDYLMSVYSKYGYFRNYLTEIRLPGAEGMSQIKLIQSTLKEQKPQFFGKYEVIKIEDWMDRKPIVSETDKASKNGMVFYLKPIEGTSSIKITIRPSGTEPKSKMYFEIGSLPFDISNYSKIKSEIENLLKDIEKSFMMYVYNILGVDFPERGFLLFWQLPLSSKLKYFEIEEKIVSLKGRPEKEIKSELTELLAFLGSDPLQKINDAFKEKYEKTIEEYLGI